MARPEDSLLGAPIRPWGSTTIAAVVSGTVIRDDATDRQETVTDTNAVRSGGIIYCTPKTYDALKAQYGVQEHDKQS
jgi:hypothetical protein